MSREIGVVDSFIKVKKLPGEHKLTDNLTTTLICEVESRPCLWNELHTDYKKWAMSRNLWDEVGATVGLSGEDARKKWKNLKDTYRRLLQRAPLKYGSDDVSVKKWKFSKMMRFTRDQLMPSVSGSVVEEEVIDDETDMETSYQADVVPECIISTPPKKGSPDVTVDKGILRLQRPKAPLLVRRNFKRKVVDFGVKKTNTCWSIKKENPPRSEEDDDYHFLMSLLPYIRPLEPLAKLELRTRVQYDVMDAYKNYEHQRSKGDPKPGSAGTLPGTSTGTSASLPSESQPPSQLE